MKLAILSAGASTCAGKPEKNEAAKRKPCGGIAYFFLDFFGTFFVKKKSGSKMNKKIKGTSIKTQDENKDELWIDKIKINPNEPYN